MKKRFISFALICVMTVSLLLLSACGGETTIEEVPAQIYTLYTICETGTTEEAIREVELALNRLTFYKLGYCIKLIMVPEDEYDDLIASKLAEIKAYNDAKAAKGKTPTSKVSSSEADETSKEVFTGEKYISMLERGEEYELKTPRLDIFLVRGYDNYINFVADNMLAPLTDKLNSEAKLIRDFVFPTFLDAANVPNAKGTRKIYGVPMNKGIGKYEYILFDKEYLKKYSIDADTMTNLEDLEYYLQIILENEPDVVPLGNIFDSPEFAYLFEKGFSAFINDGTAVIDTYSHKAVLDYYTMITRYHAMGYLKEKDSGEKWAVKFMLGTFEDIETLEKTTGRKFDYTIHSYPIATNEDLLENILCVSNYTIANELTAVSEILQYIETSPDIANLLAFGIEGTNYKLNNDNQVVRLNNTYNISLNYIGNSFLTYTLEGENPEKWEHLKRQNTDSLLTTKLSASVGFAYYPLSLKDPNGSSKTYSEPNYINVIKLHTDEFYPQIINGTLLDLNYDAIKEAVVPVVTQALTADIIQRYTDSLNATVTKEMAAKYAVGTSVYNGWIPIAEKQALKKYNTASNQKKIKDSVRVDINNNPEYEDLDSDEVEALVNQICTEEYLTEQVAIRFATEIETEIAKLLVNTQESKTKEDYNNYIKSEQYTDRLYETLNSGDCLEEINSITGGDVFKFYPDLCLEQTNELIKAELKDKIDEFFVGLNESLREAYKEFQDEYLKTFVFSDTEKRSEPDYRSSISYVVGNAKSGRTTMKSALTTELRSMVTAELGPDELPENISDTVKDRFTPKWIQDVVMDTFSYNADPEFKCATATPALRDIVNEYMTISQVEAIYSDILLQSFEKSVGLISTIKVELADGDTNGSNGEEGEGEGEEGEEPEPTEEEPIDDTLVDLETVDLYPIIFVKRIQKQYYVYKPLPTA